MGQWSSGAFGIDQRTRATPQPNPPLSRFDYKRRPVSRTGVASSEMVEDKYIGLALAVSGSVAIGTSFIITKKVSSFDHVFLESFVSYSLGIK
jgi:hypothetical protein